MPPTHQKKLGKRPEKERLSTLDVLHDTWTVMKPFVRFSIKAMRVIAHALIFVVKHIPKPEEHKKPGAKSDNVIKI